MTHWLLRRDHKGSNWFKIAQVVVPLSAVVGGLFFTYKGIQSSNRDQWRMVRQEAENKRWLERVKREKQEKSKRILKEN